MGNCSSTSKCNPCGPNYDAINQLATKTASYARQANTYATNAENSWLEFNALYLGAFAVAPTVDNEGDPLQVGALYWNSVSNTLFVWNGSSWSAIDDDEIYLGGFAVAPTLNNQGLPLQTGNAYWNTATKEFYVYNGSAWQKQLTIIGINQEFSQNNAIINRLGDKLLVGGATSHGAAFPSTVTDWFGSYQQTLNPIRVVGAIGSGSTTSGSPIVTFSVGGIVPEAGQYIFGEAIPPNTKILSVNSPTQITLDQNATSSATSITLFSSLSTSFFSGAAIGQVRSLNNTSPASAMGIVGASQSFNFNSAGTSCIGIAGFAVNNNATLGTNSWAGYFEAHRLSSTVGGTRGIEVDVSSTSAGEISPTAFQQSQTSCLQLGAGNGLSGQLPSGPQVNIGAAIQIVPNPLSFRTGIVFLANSIEGTDGYTGNGPAIRMASGHALEWHNASQQRVARLLCNAGLTSTEAMEIRYTSAGIQFLGSGSVISGYINGGLGATWVNWWALSGATTNNPPTLSATGADTNVDLRITTKGTGVVRFGTHAAITTETVTGYIQIKDSAGNIRKLAVIS
jgi:hypothetical protein